MNAQVTPTNEVRKESKIPTPHRSTDVPEFYYHKRWDTEDMMFPIYDNKGNERNISAVTAFGRMTPDGVWHVAYAECVLGDQFCRKVGRNVARRKWFAGKTTRFGVDERTDSIVQPKYDAVFTDYADVV